MLKKDNFHILINCTFGDILFLRRLLQRSQKQSLLRKGLSRNVTHFIICSSHIDWLKRVVARWHQKRAVTHLLLYHNIGNWLWTLSILVLMLNLVHYNCYPLIFWKSLLYYFLFVIIDDSKTSSEHFVIMQKNMRLTLLSSS